MTNKIESGKAGNVKETTYKGKDKDGNMIAEKIKVNKDTGETERSVNGKKVDEPKPEPKKKPAVYQYNQGNGEFLMVKLTEMIINQLKEINYRLARIEKKVAGEHDETEVEELNKEVGNI